MNDAESRDRPLEEELEDLRILEGRRPFGGRPRRTRRMLLWAVLLPLLIGIGVAVWQFWPAAKPVAVADIVVREGGATAAAMTAAGYVAAEEMATVSARVIGRLVFMLLDVGDRVRAGQVIARLDDAEYRARLRRAEADLASARAALARLEAGSRPEEIRQAEARLASAQAALEEAERNRRRTEELFRRDLIAAADRDRAWAAYETARARAQEVREGLGLARIGPREEDIAEARARGRTAEGDIQLARAQLDYTVIAAPIDGMVIDRKAQVGDTLFPGEPELSLPGRLTQLTARRGSVIGRLANMSQVKVEVDLNESDIGKVSVGSPATVVPDTAPDKKYEGRVVRVYPMADRQKKTIQVQVRIEKPDASLRPEGGARVTFHPNPPKSGGSAPLVPKAAVQKPSGTPEVFVVRDDRAQRRAVTLGAEERDYVEVRSGVARGEQVVVEGAEGLRDGDRVRVTDAARERGGSR